MRHCLKLAAMSAPTVLIGYTPDLQESGVWFGPPNCVSRRGWLPCEPSLVWVFLPDPRAKPVHCMLPVRMGRSTSTDRTQRPTKQKNNKKTTIDFSSMAFGLVCVCVFFYLLSPLLRTGRLGCCFFCFVSFRVLPQCAVPILAVCIAAAACHQDCFSSID